jgi:hypothetical protein
MSGRAGVSKQGNLRAQTLKSEPIAPIFSGMEIGPIPGVRAIGLLKTERPENRVPPAFAIDASARTGDETYSSSRQAARRGLEEDEPETDEGGKDLSVHYRGAGGLIFSLKLGEILMGFRLKY